MKYASLYKRHETDVIDTEIHISGHAMTTSWGLSFAIGAFLLCCDPSTGTRQCSATYRASVYEHAVRLPLESMVVRVSRKHALHNMMKNLRIFQEQAARAAAKVREKKKN